jgi:hypothetical protein
MKLELSIAADGALVVRPPQLNFIGPVPLGSNKIAPQLYAFNICRASRTPGERQ